MYQFYDTELTCFLLQMVANLSHFQLIYIMVLKAFVNYLEDSIKSSIMKNQFYLFPYAVIVFAVLFTITQTHAQAPDIQWQNAFGGSTYDYLRCIDATTDGGFILGGESWSSISGDKTENTFGYDDYWVIKTDASGNMMWQNNIGGSANDRLYAIQQTSGNGYILGGESSSGISGDKTEENIGYSDYWIIKLDENGNIIWQNTLGGSEFNNLRSVEQTMDGGYILGGWSSSDISGDKTEMSNGSYDYWVIKLDMSGNIVWQNTIGGDAADYLYQASQTLDGGYILAGYSSSGISGDKTEANAGTRDFWIIKLNASGNILWQNTIGGDDNDNLYALDLTADGGYILGGTSESGISGDKTELNTGGDYWIVKLDSSGNILWQNTIGGNSFDEFKTLMQTADGGYLIGGKSISAISRDKTEAVIGMDDLWIIRLDQNGNILWQNTIGGTEGEVFAGMCQLNDLSFVIGAWSLSGVSGDKTNPGYGASDYWLMQFDPEQLCITPSATASVVTADKAKVTWNAIPDALGYKIRYRIADTETWLTRFANGKDFVILKSLACNSTYEWQVMSVCADDGSSYSAYTSSDYFTTSACRFENEIGKPELLLYPNPASDRVNISISGFNGEVQIQIFDLTGQIVFVNNSTVIDTCQMIWYTGDISSGLYHLQLLINGKIYSEKILINNQ